MAHLACVLADLGVAVDCHLSPGASAPWTREGVRWVDRPGMSAEDWVGAGLAITSIAPAWRQTAISAQRAGASARLIYWHHHGPIPPGAGCVLARVAPAAPGDKPTKGWAREIVLPPSSWALVAGGERAGASIVVPGASKSKGGPLALAVARRITDCPWYVLPGRANARDLAPWRELSHVAVAPPGLQPDVWLAQARLVLSPSQAETYGLAMAEAAVRGIPVVSSDLPGPRRALGGSALFVGLGAPVAAWVAAVRQGLADGLPRLSLPSYPEVVIQALGLSGVRPTVGGEVARTAGRTRTGPVISRSAGMGRRVAPARAPVPMAPPAPPPLSGPLVTVSMPFYRTPPEILLRAVTSVLSQAERRLRLVLVNDGDGPAAWEPLADIADPRVVRFDLRENRGRYFADAVTLAACETPWWTIHDADDWSEPGRLAALLALGGEADVVLGHQIVHGVTGNTEHERCKAWRHSPALKWYAHMAALWRPAWLRSVGGPHPGYRVGYDTVMTGLAHLCGRVAVLSDPLYHRCCRPGSLTREPSTGIGSPHRKQATTRLRALWAGAVKAGADGAPAVIAGSISAEDSAAVQREAERLRALLRTGPPKAATAAALAYPGDPAMDRSLWQGWALHRATAAEIQGRLAQLRPSVALESGSGSSTLLLAEHARATGGQSVALEHQERYLAATRALLATHGLSGSVDLRLSQLDARPWYTSGVPDGIGWALIDGPPQATGGRAAALPALLPHMADGWEMWLDDGSRRSEREAALGWARERGACVEFLRVGKGLIRVTQRPVVRPPVDASDVAVTILTGGRASLLADTLDSTERICPGLLDSAGVYALRQGTDQATADVLWRHMPRINHLTEQDRIHPIGDALSQLAVLAAGSGRRYWLHLEDDWRAISTVDGWLDAARGALDEHEQVGQVRLRHLGDDVSERHMITREEIRWERRGPVRIAEAHWTFNPTLMRVSDIGRVYPCGGEMEAMRRVRDAGLPLAAHACPGMWTHIGDESLRAQTRCQS